MQAALITGASRGFGLALAERLVADGWSVVIDGRDEVALEEAAQRLRALADDPTVVAVAGDVGDPAHRDALAAATASLGRLDLLVNNASVLGPSPQPKLADYPIEVLEEVYRVNVVGPVGLVQSSIAQLRESNGTIVNITSDAAVEGYEGWGGYGSSKAALEQVSNILAAEEPAIRVYWFDPGDMRTQMHQEAFPGDDISDRPLPATVVPALTALLLVAPPSGRYRASEWLPVAP